MVLPGGPLNDEVGLINVKGIVWRVDVGPKVERAARFGKGVIAESVAGRKDDRFPFMRLRRERCVQSGLPELE